MGHEDQKKKKSLFDVNYHTISKRRLYGSATEK